MYGQLASGAETVESTLRPSIAEFLNAEVALRTVTDVSRAIQWLKVGTGPIQFAVVCDESRRMHCNCPSASPFRSFISQRKVTCTTALLHCSISLHNATMGD